MYYWDTNSYENWKTNRVEIIEGQPMIRGTRISIFLLGKEYQEENSIEKIIECYEFIGQLFNNDVIFSKMYRDEYFHQNSTGDHK